MLPSLTIYLDVSGMIRLRIRRFVPDMIARSQNIQCHERVSVITPPRMGPRLGAELVLAWNISTTARARLQVLIVLTSPEERRRMSLALLVVQYPR